MPTYKLERPLAEPTKVMPDAGVPGDWRVDFVGYLDDADHTPHFIAIQFGSKNFGRGRAQELVDKVLKVLNNA